jgi:hypothetical protein
MGKATIKAIVIPAKAGIQGCSAEARLPGFRLSPE